MNPMLKLYNNIPMDLSILKKKQIWSSVVFDVFALAFIFLVPTFSHLLSFPLYLVDPMRISLILAIALTNRKNAMLIAFMLPVFSYLISSHPLLYKVFLISGELVFNVWFFYFLINKSVKPFLSAVVSIVTSKILYYSAKFLLIYFLIDNTELISTPLYIQAIVTLVLCIFVAIFFKSEKLKK